MNRLTIPFAHDYSCEWCYVAIDQIGRLKREFDIEIDWRGFEHRPAELPRLPVEPPRAFPGRPHLPTRFELFAMLEDVELPQVERPKPISTHRAHLATEFARESHREEVFAIELYKAYWEQGEDIDEPEFLANIGERFGIDRTAMLDSISHERFADRVIHFDAPAYKLGIFNLPTFTIGDTRYAEQPYRVLQKAVQAVLEKQ